MQLSVDPRGAAADVVPTIEVTGAPPGAEVTVTLTATDARGNPWRSVTTYRADDAGTASSDADPARPWWDMAFADEHRAPTAFATPIEELEVTVAAAAGDDRAETTATRRWIHGVQRSTVEGEGFRATCLDHPDGAPRPTVVIVPGNTGVDAVLPAAGLLAAHGHGVAVLATMGDEGLPASLEEIPVEALQRGLAAIADRDRVDGGRLAVLAYSVGTIGALVALADEDAPAVRGVVAVAPSSVVWQAMSTGGPPPKTSSLTRAGVPVPWLAIHGEKVLPEVIRHATVDRLFRRHPRPTALHLRATYEPSLAKAHEVATAAIEVEHLDAPLLLVSGDEDAMWPSSEMAADIIGRRASHGIDGDVHLRFAHAGHFIRPPLAPTTVAWNDDLVAGGTPEGNAEAARASWTAILACLAGWFEPAT